MAPGFLSALAGAGRSMPHPSHRLILTCVLSGLICRGGTGQLTAGITGACWIFIRYPPELITGFLTRDSCAPWLIILLIPALFTDGDLSRTARTTRLRCLSAMTLA